MRVFSAALPYIEKFAINLLPIGVQSLLIFGDVLAGIYNFVSKNWATIEPILVGIVSGFLAFKVITKVQRMVQGALLAIRLIGSSIPAVLGAIMSPIGIAVLAFAAIGIAVYQIIKHWDTLKAWFTGFKNFVLALFGGIGQYIDNSITGFVNKVISVLGFFRDILSGISNFISGKWGKIKSVFTGIISSLAGFKIITKIQSMAVGALLAIKAIGAGIAIVLLAVMSPIGLAVIAIGAIGTIVYKIIKHWDVLKAWFKSFKDYILDLFSSAYSGIASIFSGIGAVFTGIFEGVLSSFKGYINAWVMLFNFVIKSLNNIKINIPDWVPEVGGKSFGVNIPEVPMLAQGGITTGPTLAMIGEGREQEAVLPLSKLDRLLQKPKEKPKENAGMSFTYAPNIKVSGGMESHDIRELLKEDYLEFRKMVLKVLKDYKAEENRLRFA